MEAPWPALSDEDEAFLKGTDVEPRGGEFFRHFAAEGYYACRRCRAPIARATSKGHIEGGHAAFATYIPRNLRCAMMVGRHFTKFNVRCAKCDANIGMLTKEATATGDCLRVNSRAVWYTPRNPPPTSILPADTTFDGAGLSLTAAASMGGGHEDDDDDDDDDGDIDGKKFAAELDDAFAV